MKKISPKQLKEKLSKQKLTILDVRDEARFQKQHLKHENAKNVNVFKEDIFSIEDNENVELPFTKDEEVFITCTTGNSATRCATILKEKGYEVTVLDGGMKAWNKEIK